MAATASPAERAPRRVLVVLGAALVLVLAGRGEAGLRNYDIIFEGIDDEEINREYFGPKSGMHIRRSNKSATPALYDYLDIIKALPSDTVVEVAVFERHNNKYVPSFLRYRNNFCDYLANEKRPIFKDFREAFHLPHSCPVVGQFVVDNYRPDERVLPPLLPGPERWKISFALSSGPTNLIKHAVLFLVDRSKGLRG